MHLIHQGDKPEPDVHYAVVAAPIARPTTTGTPSGPLRVTTAEIAASVI